MSKVNFSLNSSNKKKRYKKYSFLKDYNITVKDIAKMFNYSNEHSFRTSSRYHSLMESLEQFIEVIEVMREKG